MHEGEAKTTVELLGLISFYFPISAKSPISRFPIM